MDRKGRSFRRRSLRIVVLAALVAVLGGLVAVEQTSLGGTVVASSAGGGGGLAAQREAFDRLFSSLPQIGGPVEQVAAQETPEGALAKARDIASSTMSQAQESAAQQPPDICAILLGLRANLIGVFQGLIAGFPALAATLGAIRDTALAVIDALVGTISCPLPSDVVPPPPPIPPPVCPPQPVFPPDGAPLATLRLSNPRLAAQALGSLDGLNPDGAKRKDLPIVVTVIGSMFAANEKLSVVVSGIGVVGQVTADNTGGVLDVFTFPDRVTFVVVISPGQPPCPLTRPVLPGTYQVFLVSASDTRVRRSNSKTFQVEP